MPEVFSHMCSNENHRVLVELTANLTKMDDFERKHDYFQDDVARISGGPAFISSMGYFYTQIESTAAGKYATLDYLSTMLDTLGIEHEYVHETN